MLLDQIQSDLVAGQKARDQLKVDTLRFLLGAVFNLGIEKGKDYKLTDSDVLSVVSKQVKTHNESIEMFIKGERADLVARERAELVILQGYLPAQLSEQDVRAKVEEVRKQNPAADFGAMMRLAMAELRGKADGAVVSRLLKELM